MLRKNDEICLPGGVRGIRCGALSSCLVLGTRAGSALLCSCAVSQDIPPLALGSFSWNAGNQQHVRGAAVRPSLCQSCLLCPGLTQSCRGRLSAAVPSRRGASAGTSLLLAQHLLRRHGLEMGGSGIASVALELVMLKLLLLTAQAGS